MHGITKPVFVLLIITHYYPMTLLTTHPILSSYDDSSFEGQKYGSDSCMHVRNLESETELGKGNGTYTYRKYYETQEIRLIAYLARI
jgi:hypothetical protein